MSLKIVSYSAKYHYYSTSVRRKEDAQSVAARQQKIIFEKIAGKIFERIYGCLGGPSSFISTGSFFMLSL